MTKWTTKSNNDDDKKEIEEDWDYPLSSIVSFSFVIDPISPPRITKFINFSFFVRSDTTNLSLSLSLLFFSHSCTSHQSQRKIKIPARNFFFSLFLSLSLSLFFFFVRFFFIIGESAHVGWRARVTRQHIKVNIRDSASACNASFASKPFYRKCRLQATETQTLLYWFVQNYRSSTRAPPPPPPFCRPNTRLPPTENTLSWPVRAMHRFIARSKLSKKTRRTVETPMVEIEGRAIQKKICSTCYFSTGFNFVHFMGRDQA